jgi:hypothetical protein
MLTAECQLELQTAWLPNLTNRGLDRLIELLEQGSPLLIHGCFSRAMPMGCLATHAAWHHPETAHLNIEAGIRWLTAIAGLNPATSHVLREWDRGGCWNWQLRADLLDAFLFERRRRRAEAAEESASLALTV